MHDPLTFEARLSDAFERYLADARTEVHAATVAAQVAAAHGDRTVGWIAGISHGRRRVAIVLAVGLLLVALTATAVFFIGRRQHQPPVPFVYSNQLINAPNLLQPRAFTQAVTLLDGRVLIGGDSATFEVFDPVDGSVRAAAKIDAVDRPVIGRIALLRDGRVLVIGVNQPEAGPETAIALTFDPRTLEFRLVGPMGAPRRDAWIGALADGRALVIGGELLHSDPSDPSDITTNVEVFNPLTNTFSPLPHMLDAIPISVNPTLLPDGRLVVFAYLPASGQPVSPSAGVLEIFDPRTNSFTEAGRSEFGSPAGSVLSSNAVVDLLDDGRLFIAGEAAALDGAGIPGGSAVIWNPANETFGEVMTIAPWPPSSVVHLNDGRVFMIGPADSSNTRASGARTIDPRTGESTVVGPLSGCLPKAVRLLDGRILLIGGVEDCEIHHPELGGLLAPAVSSMQIFE